MKGADAIHVLSVVVAHESKEAMKRMRALREDTDLQYWIQCNQAMLQITQGIINHEGKPDIKEIPNPNGCEDGYFITKLKHLASSADHSSKDTYVASPFRFEQARWSDLHIEEDDLDRRFLIIETFAMGLALHGFWTKIWHYHPKHRDFMTKRNTSKDLRFSICRDRYLLDLEESTKMGQKADVNAEREDVYPQCRQPWTAAYTLYPPCVDPPKFKKQKIDGVMHRPKSPRGYNESSSDDNEGDESSSDDEE